METKPALLLGIAMGAASLGVWGVFYAFLKPHEVREPSAGGAFIFPGKSGSAPTAPPQAAAPYPSSPGPRASGGPASAGPEESSLGFIQKDASLSSPSARPSAPPAARAPASAPAAPRAPSPNVLRVSMQAIVDSVHKKQPGWYREFLGSRDLKAAADAYDESRDFPAFLKALASSRNFHRMLAARAGTKALRDLLLALFNEPDTSDSMSMVFKSVVADPHGWDLSNQYGAKAGLPDGSIPDQRPAGEAPAVPGAPAAPRMRTLQPMSSSSSGGQGKRGQRLKGWGDNFSSGR
ncbi:MAG TPA: hypothetical protein VNI01_10815 [Elusimicrobiota bacterium]|nr:hypothetical protein [Elusimicrobiota bacterium]